MSKIIDHFGSERRFYIVATILILMWLLFLGILWLRSEELLNHPCKLCAKKLNEDVICKSTSSSMVSRVFHPDLTFTDITE